MCIFVRYECTFYGVSANLFLGDVPNSVATKKAENVTYTLERIRGLQKREKR